MKTIKISTEYSETPLGRYPEDGDYNGARFRDDYLRAALEKEDKVVVDIDDVEGYGSSFLEEAFGGLVRKGYFTATDLKRKLEIRYLHSEFRIYGELIWKYIKEAKVDKKN